MPRRYHSKHGGNEKRIHNFNYTHSSSSSSSSSSASSSRNAIPDLFRFRIELLKFMNLFGHLVGLFGWGIRQTQGL
jgi:hypothetical protein